MDPAHPKHEAGNPFEHAIRDYYRHVDAELAELLALCPSDTLVLVVSDHGAKKMDGGICFNEWLMREGYLTLATRPSKPTPIGQTAIDWTKTRAWGDGGYYGRHPHFRERHGAGRGQPRLARHLHPLDGGRRGPSPRPAARRVDLRHRADGAPPDGTAPARRARGQAAPLMRTVAVDILTGFLGSGKTTLLRHVLEHGLRGKPVAVIMNEIGEVGIDGRVVTGLANVEKMVELTSGCICCSIDDYRFDLAIQEIIDTAKPHLIVIEST